MSREDRIKEIKEKLERYVEKEYPNAKDSTHFWEESKEFCKKEKETNN